MVTRNIILIGKKISKKQKKMPTRATLKRITLSNGRTFVARYERVTCNHLPANIRLRQPYKQRAAPCGRR